MYRSKVSFGLLIFIFLIFFAPVVFDLVYNELDKVVLVVLVLLLITYAFILHMFFQTLYIIEDGQLKIRMGFFSFKPITINDIKEISKTNSILSSPAASLDRIEIKYGKLGSVIISPKDKLSFAKELVQLNPEIKNNLQKNP
jgi:hypothetical protein